MLQRLSIRVLRPLIVVFLLGIGVVVGGCGGTSSLRTPTVFYPTPPQLPRVQYLTRYQNDADVGVQESGFRKFITGKGTSLDGLQKPHFSIWSDGRIYVCDTRRGEIVIMDLQEHRFEIMGKAEGFRFGKPLGMAIASDGTKYVADNVNKRIYVFDAGDRFLRAYGEDGQFGPTGVAVFGDRLFIADAQDHEVEILNRLTGEVVANFRGSDTVDTGLFLMPANLTVDNDGNLYVSDLLAGNIQVFDTDLKYLRTVGRLGDQLGTFGRPRGVAVDDNGNTYVTDAAFENVQVFDPEGVPLIFFGGPGVDPGRMYMPAGITVAKDAVSFFRSFADDRFELETVVLVTSQYGPNGVSVYGVGRGKPGYFDDSGAGK